MNEVEFIYLKYILQVILHYSGGNTSQAAAVAISTFQLSLGSSTATFQLQFPWLYLKDRCRFVWTVTLNF